MLQPRAAGGSTTRIAANDHFFRLRVRAALRAAAARPAGPFVRTAFRAAAFKDPAPRFRAAERACRASAVLEAALRPSRRRAERTALARLADGLVRDRERPRASCALRRVLSEVVPFSGGGSSTPARRALERPIATACLADRAPCFPSRMWCISSRTNSPAWVVGALPWRLSRLARSSVSFSGIVLSPSGVHTPSNSVLRCRLDSIALTHHPGLLIVYKSHNPRL